jgi:hypothetical protein
MTHLIAIDWFAIYRATNPFSDKNVPFRHSVLISFAWEHTKGELIKLTVYFTDSKERFIQLAFPA